VAGPPAGPGGPERLLLSVVQAAGVLGVGRTTAYQLIRAGELEVVHVGRSVRVPADALPDLVRRLRAGRRGGPAVLGYSAGSSRPAGTIRSVAPGDGSQRPAARTA
jgi:excisionase family DNA binding protein